MLSIAVKNMKNRVELPLLEPLYSTYQYQGPGSAVLVNNPSIRNWYFNEVMNLTCSRKFLAGYTTPEITVVNTFWSRNPYLENVPVPTQFINRYINSTIQEMLNLGYYVPFDKVDDYYVKGKSWYRARHFSHDGIICGYDQDEKTYCIYAYDSNWVYRKFWTPQRAFNKGRMAMEQQGISFEMCGTKPYGGIVVDFSPKTAYDKLAEYLYSDLDIYPFDGEGNVYGIIVHEYVAEYLNQLYRNAIPYDRMDRRVFRMIWEHKKVMLERICMIEQHLSMNRDISEQYKSIVAEADIMRMMYASHQLRRRDSLLPIIKKKLLTLMRCEKELLTMLVEKMEKELKNEVVDISSE